MASAFCTAGKKALLDGKVSDTWKIALYTSLTGLDNTLAAYTATNEVANGAGYTTGGNTLSGAATSDDTSANVAWITFSNSTWATATFSAVAALIYDSSDSNRAYAVIDFGGTKTGQGGNFTIVFPTADATHAIIRIG